MLENFFRFVFFEETLLAILIRMAIILFLTWLASVLGSRLAVQMLRARSRAWQQVDSRRVATLEALVRSAVKFFVYITGLIVLFLGLGVAGGSILTALAVFSAGFGFAARPIISDYLAGIILIFEDQFSVGDKVEMLEITGMVEAVDLRTTHLRSTTGELYIIPNGDVRIIRNLSRGLFSVATVKVTVATKDLTEAMEVLTVVADRAQTEVETLIERPEYFSEEGAISSHVLLTLSAKARYGQGARARTRLMTMVTEALEQAKVQIIN